MPEEDFQFATSILDELVKTEKGLLRILQIVQKEIERNSEVLNNKIKQEATDEETIRNKRQVATTAFQNFDQKANQLFNLLATVLKVMDVRWVARQ